MTELWLSMDKDGIVGLWRGKPTLLDGEYDQCGKVCRWLCSMNTFPAIEPGQCIPVKLEKEEDGE